MNQGQCLNLFENERRMGPAGHEFRAWPRNKESHVNRIKHTIRSTVPLFALLILCGLDQPAHAKELSVSPAVVEKAAKDAEKLQRNGQIENDILELFPGAYQGVDPGAREARRRIEADNRRIQNSVRNLNNSIRDINTRINRINTLNRRF